MEKLCKVEKSLFGNSLHAKILLRHVLLCESYFTSTLLTLPSYKTTDVS
jgi:hypothetical protein